MRNSLSEAVALNDGLLGGSLLDGDFTCLLLEFRISNLAFVELAGFDLSAGLEGSHDALVFPAHLMGETSNSAKPSALLQAEDLQAAWHYHTLLFVVGTLEARRKVKSSQFHKRQVADEKLREKAREIAIQKAAPQQAIIESYGFR